MNPHATPTDAIAVGAVTSPWWLPKLHSVSVFAQEALPIVGLGWLLLQIGFKLHAHFRKKTRD